VFSPKEVSDPERNSRSDFMVENRVETEILALCPLSYNQNFFWLMGFEPTTSRK